MKDRAPLGELVRDAKAMVSRYEREVTTQTFSSLEECVTYSVREKLGPSWGIYQNDRGFWICAVTDLNAPQGFIRWCPPFPPPPEPLKWATYCGYCGGVVWAGESSCSDCGWTGSEGEGWDD